MIDNRDNRYPKNLSAPI